MLKRVFDVGREHCPTCGDDLKIIAAILESPVIHQSFARLGRLTSS